MTPLTVSPKVPGYTTSINPMMSAAMAIHSSVSTPSSFLAQPKMHWSIMTLSRKPVNIDRVFRPFRVPRRALTIIRTASWRFAEY